jgi:hypothetical protein
MLRDLRAAAKVDAKNPEDMLSVYNAMNTLEATAPKSTAAFVKAALASPDLAPLASSSPALAALSVASADAATLAINNPRLARLAVLSPEAATMAQASPELGVLASVSPPAALLAVRAIKGGAK